MGVTAYEVRLEGDHQVSLSGANRDFAPRWHHIAVSDHQKLGLEGTSLTVIFDGQLGRWAGSGYFTDRFDADELIEAVPSSITENLGIADWPGVNLGSAIAVGRASSQSQCETITGIRVCPREESFNVSEREFYRAGIGPIAYLFQSSASFSGGSFFSSYQTTENVGLVASSLRGDVTTVLDEPRELGTVEIEPNDSMIRAQRLSVPSAIAGYVFTSDSNAELRFYDLELEQWQYVELHDVYVIQVSEQRPVTITLESQGSGNVDLNLLVITLSEINDEDSIYFDGELAELVDLSTTNDPVETITSTLSPGEYFIAVQAFVTRARASYVLTIE